MGVGKEVYGYGWIHTSMERHGYEGIRQRFIYMKSNKQTGPKK